MYLVNNGFLSSTALSVKARRVDMGLGVERCAYVFGEQWVSFFYCFISKGAACGHGLGYGDIDG
jgi:hypothetical protein